MIFSNYFLKFLLLSTCLLASRSPSVDLGDKCLSEFNLSYFRGIYPDITVDELYKIAGKPDDKFEVTGDDPGIDLAYYNEQGRLLLHWSGDEDYEIGMIEIRPKIRVSKKDFMRGVFSVNKEVVSFSCHEEHKLTIFFEKDMNTIKEIHFWNK